MQFTIYFVRESLSPFILNMSFYTCVTRALTISQKEKCDIIFLSVLPFLFFFFESNIRSMMHFITVARQVTHIRAGGACVCV